MSEGLRLLDRNFRKSGLTLKIEVNFYETYPQTLVTMLLPEVQLVGGGFTLEQAVEDLASSYCTHRARESQSAILVAKREEETAAGD